MSSSIQNLTLDEPSPKPRHQVPNLIVVNTHFSDIPVSCRIKYTLDVPIQATAPNKWRPEYIPKPLDIKIESKSNINGPRDTHLVPISSPYRDSRYAPRTTADLLASAVDTSA
jgi:hypothetical protein